MNNLQITEGYFSKVYYTILFILNHAICVYVGIGQHLNAIAKLYENVFKQILISFRSHIYLKLTFGIILGMLLSIQVLTDALISTHCVLDILNSYNVITLQNMQNENFIYYIQGSIFGASLEQLKIKILTEKGVAYLKQHDALFKNAFSNYKDKIVLGKYHLFNSKYKYIRYSLFIISMLFTRSISLELNILPPLLFNFVHLIRMFFLGWLGCSVIAASFFEFKIIWACWWEYQQSFRLLGLEGTVVTTGIQKIKTAIGFGFKIALTIVKACLGILCTGYFVIDPTTEYLGVEKPVSNLVKKGAPFAQKYFPLPEWAKDTSSPHYAPKHRGS